jgi:WD40 repeat protein
MQTQNSHLIRFQFATLVCITTLSPTLGQVLNEDVKLLPGDGSEGDNFGWSIAIDSGLVVVGAFATNDNGVWSGSAYIFDAVKGTQVAKLLPDDGMARDQFGGSVAISDGIVAVGAPDDDDNGNESGSVYLFDALTGQMLRKLLPNDGSPNDQFGYSVAIENDTVVVGAYTSDDNGLGSGSAYIFSVSSGTQIAKLLPNDGNPDANFGYSIALDDGIVAIGARWDNDNGIKSGSAYLFDSLTGVQLHKLLPNTGTAEEYFGVSVDIANGIVVVGAYLAAGNVGPFSGTAYVFDALTGTQIATLVPSDGVENGYFGSSVSIDDHFIAVGAHNNFSNTIRPGAAYIFDIATGLQLAKLIPSDGESNDSFGRAISISNGVVSIGAQGNDDMGVDSGSAYIFHVYCPADLNGDFSVDFFDVSAFLTFFSISNPTADWNADGIFDFFDVMAYLADFAAGCP